MPEWRAYWASGERDAWPFLHRADYQYTLKGLPNGGAATES